MCGIIVRAQNIKEKPEKYEDGVGDQVLHQFEDQHGRGTQGFGSIFIAPDGTLKTKRATEPYKMLYDIHDNPSNFIVFHHRIPTSTPNLIKQTHPIVVKQNSLNHIYMVIHNGIITNCNELQVIHYAANFPYTTMINYGEKEMQFNDTESFAIELARLLDGQTKEIKCIGSAAFVALQISPLSEKNPVEPKVEKIFFGRSASAALQMAQTRDRLWINSVGPGTEIKADTLYSWDIRDKNMNLRKIPVQFTNKRMSWESFHENVAQSNHDTETTSAAQRLETKLDSAEMTRELIAERTKELGFPTKRNTENEFECGTGEKENAGNFDDDPLLNGILEEAYNESESCVSDFLDDLTYPTWDDGNLEYTITEIASILKTAGIEARKRHLEREEEKYMEEKNEEIDVLPKGGHTHLPNEHLGPIIA